MPLLVGCFAVIFPRLVLFVIWLLGNGWLGRAAVLANRGLIRLSRSLFSYQIYVVAESTPDVSFVLRDTQSRSAARVSNGVEASTDGRHWS